MLKRIYLFASATLAACFLSFYTGFAQESRKEVVSNIINSVNKHAGEQAIERLYIQTDKPAYQTGDTLRFKAYLLEAATLKASKKSGIMYLEIANDSSRLMKRIMVPVNGIAYGNVSLGEMPQGAYIIRAYTNWMRNYDEAYIFTKPFYFTKVADNDWLVNYSTKTVSGPEAAKVQLALKITNLEKAPVGLRELQLKITDGKRTWFKNKVDTDLDGLTTINFELPAKADLKNLTLSVRDLRKGEDNRNLTVPIALNRSQNIDVQFMPEGGNLIAGLPAYVAFKSINEEGLGTDITGSVYNSKQQEVAAFSSTQRGIGAFYMLPQVGETYTAKVRLADGTFKNFPLPLVKTSGFTLKVNNVFNSDTLAVNIAATPDMALSTNAYYLIGHTRGMVYYGAALRFDNNVARLLINKKLFPGGITHLTLIGADKKLLNDRLIYADRNSKLNIHVTFAKPLYKQRDSVALNMQVTDMYGDPVEGSFSLAVTDNGQVKIDSLKRLSINNYVLLTAGLKGTIEDPGYYNNSSSNLKTWQDLDRLLLAQGWSAYEWNNAVAPAKPALFPVETEYLITGRVTNAFNKPVPNSRVTLLSKKPTIIADTVTNANGTFTFKDIVAPDTAVFFLQARNKKGKNSNVGIEVDEFKQPVFAPLTERFAPWYLNTDSTDLFLIKKQSALKQTAEVHSRGKMLKEVVIKNKRIVKDSKNLNGPGEADQIIDQEQLEKAGTTKLRDLLYKNIKGFGPVANKFGVIYYRINGQLVHIIIDGIDIDFLKPEGVLPYDYFNQYLDYYDAGDIKGIELMKNMAKVTAYTNRFVDPMAVPWEHAFIEVTTRSGHGPFVKKSMNTYVYRPLPFTLPQQFYTPKYKADAVPDMTDIRSTIHWEPNIVTDKDGKATISFYTADTPGQYTIIAEGADFDGNVGTTNCSIKVEKK